MRFGCPKFVKIHLPPWLRPGLCRPRAKSFGGQKKKEEVQRKGKEKRKREGRKARGWCKLGQLLPGADRR